MASLVLHHGLEAVAMGAILVPTNDAVPPPGCGAPLSRGTEALWGQMGSPAGSSPGSL